MSTAAPAPHTYDGRSARSARTRAAVVGALLTLVGEGDLRPTAARIAERAGVSVRSIFQHFEDLEALRAAAATRQTERLAEMFPSPAAEGTLTERIGSLVDQRARLLEAVSPLQRSAVLHEPFSAVLRAHRDLAHYQCHRELEASFALELAGLDDGDRQEVLAALMAATTWDAWEYLRARENLSVAGAKRVVTRTVRALLCADGVDREQPGHYLR